MDKCPVIGSTNMELKNGKSAVNGNHKVVTNGQHLMGQQDALCALECPHSDPQDYTCGLWSFRPKLFQNFTNKKTFLIVFCLTSVLQGMYYTYFVSVLTTIEKLYQIQSKTTGIIMSATEIGQIGGALLLTYYGGQGHRPKWIACGMLVFAFSSILCSMPHFLFGGDVRSLHENSTTSKHTPRLCHLSENITSESAFDNESFRSPVTTEFSKCDSAEISIQQARITNAVLAVFFISLLFIGIGATAVYTLGIPYIDDNVATRESPLYFGITIGVRIFGPVFGFLLGSFCTSIYVNFPFGGDPGISPDDPQWIGAWWLGVFIVGAALFFTSVPMMAFPRKLPPSDSPHHKQSAKCQHHLIFKNNQSVKKQSKTPSLRDFPTAMRRLLRNDVLLCRTASSVLHILPIAGLYTFLPKYLESQFQLTATKANMISGIAGILVMGIGIFASGTFMRKFKPNATFVAKWISVAALIYSLGMVILMWLGCPLNKFIGLNADSISVPTTCSENCGCNIGEFSPVCANDITYVSPCLAGCHKRNTSTDEQVIFIDCQCLSANTTAVAGYCPLTCNNLIWYIVVFSFFVLIHSTSEVGSMMLTLRCVDPQDKAMALGLISFAIGLFGNVPCPIIYGAVVDSACLFWEDNCGEPGACRVYDPDKFRMVFHGLTAAIMFAAFLVDALVCYKARSIQFQEEEHVTNADEMIPMNSGPCGQFESSV